MQIRLSQNVKDRFFVSAKGKPMPLTAGLFVILFILFGF